MSAYGDLHKKLVSNRRSRVLANWLLEQIPEGAKVLDVGCGDGNIAKRLLEAKPGISIEGIDVLLRPPTFIPVTKFDGTTIPFPDKSFDVVMFVDVLHHTDDPSVLLAEARRVARKAVILKDHCRDGVLAGSTLRLMDWVGNRHHGVVLPYNYWPEAKWRTTFEQLALTPTSWNANLGLFGFPLSLAFERKLHFIARLTPAS